MTNATQTSDADFLVGKGWKLEDPKSPTGHKWGHIKAGPARYRTWEAVKIQLDIDKNRPGDEDDGEAA